jgi:hypothetical protein
LKPKLVFLVSYYGIEGYSLVKACKELRIPTVDLQHGVQGPLHPAYGRFTGIPSSGYELLPNYFWIWSSQEAGVITAWNSGCEEHHKAIVGGNPWLDRWLDGDSEAVRRHDARVRELQERTTAKRHVLVTLQTGLSLDDFLEPLIRLAHLAGPDWRWWIRLHPGMQGYGAAVVRKLNDRKMVNFDVENASSLPLYALLRQMDLHVTYSSSVVLEAAHFGVPSVVCSEVAKELFAEQIASGAATYFPLGAFEDIESLQRLCGRRRERGANSVRQPAAAESLAALCRAVGIPTNTRSGGQI